MDEDQTDCDGPFISPTASVIGNVRIGSKTSVWYGAIIRGDVNSITIGEQCSIGDRAMLHCSGISENKPTLIGNKVIIGAGAIVHGCTLEDECMIGYGAQILDGAKVSKYSIVAPGSVLRQEKVVASGQLWGGIPAAFIRDLTVQEKNSISITAAENRKWAEKYSKETNLPWRLVEIETSKYLQVLGRNDFYYKRLMVEVSINIHFYYPSNKSCFYFA